MSIIITEGFQLNSNLPIDSRFVVGATAYGSNPPPFYSNRASIVYKYPGLRIWDFNDNVPYVWDGAQWINENTTGAIVQNASTGYTGYQNFITKFANNTTLLTKSLLFDDSSNIGLGLTGSAVLPNGVVSNTTGTPVNTINPPLSQSPYKSGIHAAGNIRTNQYFSGDGRYIINLNAYNISSGYLSLDRITQPGGLPTDVYILKNTLGLTSWDLVTNVVPIPGAQNTGAGTGIIYGGVVSNSYQFKTLESLGLDISTGTQSITMESKPGAYIGTDTSSTRIYRFNNTTKLHEYFSLKSNSLKISQQLDGGGNITGNVMIEVPSSGSTDGLFINSSYIPTFDDWDKGIKDTNGFYKGDGTLAKPFTNSIKYDITTMNVISITANTAIQNGIDFYIGTGTKTNAQNRYRLITVQSPGLGGTYIYAGDLNINNLRIKFEASMVSTTTDYLVDMDGAIDPATSTYVFPTNSADVVIEIVENCTIEIRGTLDPWNGGDNSQPIPVDGFRAVGGRLPGKGFRNSGNNLLTNTYGSGKTLYLNGTGVINSYYYSSTGLSTPNPLNIYLFTLDSTAGFQGGGANITNGNNDGGICIQVNCKVQARFQAIYYVNGNSKLEFTRYISSGDLSNTFASTGGDFYNLECFIQKGGLIRLFNIEFGVSNGRRNTVFTFQPDDQFRIGSSFIVRNSQFSGSGDNWFHKKSIGCANLDITGCTTLYFNGFNLFRTTDSYSTVTSSALDIEGRGENWNGTKDKRWGSYWWGNPANGGSGATASPALGKPVPYGGAVNLKNNTFEDININQNCVDLTQSNSRSVFNSIGGPIESLQRFEYYGLSYVVNNANSYGLYKYGAFLYVDNNVLLNPGTPTVVGQTYEIVSCTVGAMTSPFWSSVGYLTSTLNYAPASATMGKGIPAQYKTFICIAVGTIPTGVVLTKIERKVFM